MLQEQGAPALMPWDRAPVSGYYLLLNVFGTPTGERAFVERGVMPFAPRPQRWQFKDVAENNWLRRAKS